jgi:hypothetical protein
MSLERGFGRSLRLEFGEELFGRPGKRRMGARGFPK